MSDINIDSLLDCVADMIGKYGLDSCCICNRVFFGRATYDPRPIETDGRCCSECYYNEVLVTIEKRRKSK